MKWIDEKEKLSAFKAKWGITTEHMGGKTNKPRTDFPRFGSFCSWSHKAESARAADPGSSCNSSADQTELTFMIRTFLQLKNPLEKKKKKHQTFSV